MQHLRHNNTGEYELIYRRHECSGVYCPQLGADRKLDGLGVIVTFTPAAEAHPPAVIDRLLYVPAGAVIVAAPPATLTPVKLPACICYGIRSVWNIGKC